MARNIISREFTMTKVTVYVFDEETMTAQAHEATLKGAYEDKAKAEKAVAKLAQFKDKKVVKVAIIGTENKMLGMTVEDFMKYAVELDENRRIIKDDADNEATDEE